MELSVYEIESEVEATHWWFKERRWLFGRMLRDIPRNAKVLDVGSGTGSNLRMLVDAGFRDVRGLDMSPAAAQFAKAKNLPPIEYGDVQRLPYEAETFDLLLATDVVEHVDDDAKAVQELARILRPGGHLLVTVPCFQSLWGPQDELAMHKRRFRLEEISSRIENAGLQIKQAFYFNYLLFVPIWLARRILIFMKAKLRSENEINSPLINAILSAVFRFDVMTAPVLSPPFGVSALVFAQKPLRPAARA